MTFLELLLTAAAFVLAVRLLCPLWLRRGPGIVPRILAGLVFGALTVLANRLSFSFSPLLLNLRNIGPLAAGMFFDPLSGVIAGLIGGADRFLFGAVSHPGEFIQLGCAVSTVVAGLLPLLLNPRCERKRRPSVFFAMILGAATVVFEMYMIFLTHCRTLLDAFDAVTPFVVPMVLAACLGMAGCSLVLRVADGKEGGFLPSFSVKSLFRRFRFWLLLGTGLVFASSFVISYLLETRAAQESIDYLLTGLSRTLHEELAQDGEAALRSFSLSDDAQFLIFTDAGLPEIRISSAGEDPAPLSGEEAALIRSHYDASVFYSETLFGPGLYQCRPIEGGNLYSLVFLDYETAYGDRDAQALENAFALILVFAAIYLIVSVLMDRMVLKPLDSVNGTLTRITEGKLDESVSDRSSDEFETLSDHINMTVDALKGYISAAEKRIEEDLQLARTIQASALPRNFSFPRVDFRLYAIMDPAKEVGGDFYDFFFIGPDRLVLVIADVSGKSIPGALFMMQAKAAVRNQAEAGTDSPAEILRRANEILCEGNDAEMFVTVWIGIVDLKTGRMDCANAGHEYPILCRAGGSFELCKDRHGPPLAAIDGARFREYTLEFSPGDRLFVYTDGIPEAINTETEAYGTERMLAALNAYTGDTPEGLLGAVRQDLSSFVGAAEPFDDVTMLGFWYLG